MIGNKKIIGSQLIPFSRTIGSPAIILNRILIPNKIKSIVAKCLEKGESFPSWPEILAEHGCDVEPYNMMTAIIKIKLDNGAFYVALKYKVKDKADFIVGKFAGWTDN